jgi:hypothetical protein
MEDMSAIRYEFMIRRAFDCGRGKKGADADIYRRLQELEYYAKESPQDAKAQKQYQKQLDQVKDYSKKAVDKGKAIAYKNDSTPAKLVLQLDEHSAAIKSATDSKEIAQAINSVTTIFNDLGIGNK